MKDIALVDQAHNWEHDVSVDTTVGSEQIAETEGKVGMSPRDPFAMFSF
jgi:GTP-dependent phosphoenolpyruvate carboxykinase